ncbi:hypothetical protein PV416_00740 [Streptomyces ipomoeae]|uniref:hypothetical protein n=1 Tax=Streptomyces ipomoeae TaxID=103232 RepID=UPI001319EB17|nr:hypothetical protein [Streptomyces ipomoeae]MDX2692232.1 hypothetical protein [Streptomyces ipomoeae]MDX2819646.1 hypothetical protein [Streptomyces ipomoeae]MDX2838809.1 hypothetical protein [Streptomyces ipomoeae]MDX2872334.1 hypothetical protein [Streptomyces ipomoeae]
MLVRAVGEALLDVEKHARARSVVVTLAAYDDRASVVVMNNGVGWPEPEQDATTARVARRQLFHDPDRPSRMILPVIPAR